MLKLEKVAKTLGVNIILRKKEPLLTKNLLLALFFATALHVAAGLIFNVRAILLNGSQSLIPPVMVDAVMLPAADAAVQVQLEEDLLPRTVQEPKKSEPTLPDWPRKGPVAISEPLWNKNPFAELAFLPALEPPSAKKEAHLHFSGPLAEARILYQPNPPPFAYKGSFHARLEGSTGRLFWFEPLQAHPQEQAVEAWLKEFRFEPNPELFVEGGDIEVRIG